MFIVENICYNYYEWLYYLIVILIFNVERVLVRRNGNYIYKLY